MSPNGDWYPNWKDCKTDEEREGRYHEILDDMNRFYKNWQRVESENERLRVDLHNCKREAFAWYCSSCKVSYPNPDERTQYINKLDKRFPTEREVTE